MVNSYNYGEDAGEWRCAGASRIRVHQQGPAQTSQAEE
jgi:hypothetical protein